MRERDGVGGVEVVGVGEVREVREVRGDAIADIASWGFALALEDESSG